MKKTLFIIGLILAFIPLVIVILLHFLNLITTANISIIFVLSILSMCTGFELINVSTKEEL